MPGGGGEFESPSDTINMLVRGLYLHLPTALVTVWSQSAAACAVQCTFRIDLATNSAALCCMPAVTCE